VRARLRVHRANLPAPAARRAEETVTHTLNAFSALEESVAILIALRDACCDELRHPDHPEQLAVGPHDFDGTVITAGEDGPPQVQNLYTLLKGREHALKVEFHHADPRTLLLSTLGQMRQHIELAVKLVERIHTVQEVERFQEEVLHAISEADEATARRLRAALHDRRTLRLALRPPGPGE
jgi:hypothetical protein